MKKLLRGWILWGPRLRFCKINTTSSSECHSSLEKEEKGEIAVFVGPEGGWSEAEINLFKQNNFKILSLGSNILRAETAAIVGSSLFLIL